MARVLRSGSAIAWLRSASEVGNINAAPTPCRMRKILSADIVGDTPQSTEATVNIARPVMKTRFAP